MKNVADTTNFWYDVRANLDKSLYFTKTIVEYSLDKKNKKYLSSLCRQFLLTQPSKKRHLSTFVVDPNEDINLVHLYKQFINKQIKFYS